MSDPASIHVVAISGSLRRASYNSAALRAARDVMPDGMTMEIVGIGALPLYNEDARVDGDPASVIALRERIATAHAILIATPEYNFSVPGVLKNAIDWISRVPELPFNDKPLGIIGASTGILGTGRAQYHLRQMAVFLNMHVMNKPEVFIARAQEKFDADGRLTDDRTREFLRTFMAAFAVWARRMRQ